MNNPTWRFIFYILSGSWSISLLSSATKLPIRRDLLNLKPYEHESLSHKVTNHHLKTCDLDCEKEKMARLACDLPFPSYQTDDQQHCYPSLSTMCGESYQACSPPSTGHGYTICDRGECEVICDLGYQLHQASKTCWPPQSLFRCGLPAEVCRDPLSGHGFAICVNGTCGVGCDDGFVVSSDGKDCIHQGDWLNCGNLQCLSPSQHGHPICISNQTCDYGCEAGYRHHQHHFKNLIDQDQDSRPECESMTSNVERCGQSEWNCLKIPNNGKPICNSGVCDLICPKGMALDRHRYWCIGIEDDTENCGGIGHDCYRPDHGTPTCVRGKCDFVCDYGYQRLGLTCSSTTLEPQPHLLNSINGLPKSRTHSNGYLKDEIQQDRSKSNHQPHRYRLCPAPDETPCPTSNLDPLAFKNFIDQWPEMMTQSEWQRSIQSLPGSYECLLIDSSLESCGGCVNEIGNGQNCMLIDNADGVGCEDGRCVVLSCQSGYQVDQHRQACHQIKRLF